MSLENLLGKKALLVGIVAFSIWSLLLWQYFHDGVPVHYLLQREDFPALSNWWGGICLPLLTWILLNPIRQECSSHPGVTVPLGFAAGVFYGMALSVTFTYGLQQLTSLMMPLLLVSALFFRLYRAHYVLGFVFGMVYTFGALLPTGVAVTMVMLTFIIYNYIRPTLVFLLAKLRR